MFNVTASILSKESDQAVQNNPSSPVIRLPINATPVTEFHLH